MKKDNNQQTHHNKLRKHPNILGGPARTCESCIRGIRISSIWEPDPRDGEKVRQPNTEEKVLLSVLLSTEMDQRKATW